MSQNVDDSLINRSLGNYYLTPIEPDNCNQYGSGVSKGFFNNTREIFHNFLGCKSLLTQLLEAFP